MYSPDLLLEKIQLQGDIKVALLSYEVPNARQRAVSLGVAVFVGFRFKGTVHATVDSAGEVMGDEVLTTAEGLTMPIGACPA